MWILLYGAKIGRHFTRTFYVMLLSLCTAIFQCQSTARTRNLHSSMLQNWCFYVHNSCMLCVLDQQQKTRGQKLRLNTNKIIFITINNNKRSKKHRMLVFPHCFFIILILHCYARSTLEHYVRVRAKSRVLGGSLGRSFSRSCAGLVGPPPVAREPISADTRRASLRVSTTTLHASFALLNPQKLIETYF